MSDMDKFKRYLLLVLMLILGAVLVTGCDKAPEKVDFQQRLPKDGWHAYKDDTRGVTCFFYQHPTERNTYFGAGCVTDNQWKK